MSLDGQHEQRPIPGHPETLQLLLLSMGNEFSHVAATRESHGTTYLAAITKESPAMNSCGVDGHAPTACDGNVSRLGRHSHMLMGPSNITTFGVRRWRGAVG